MNLDDDEIRYRQSRLFEKPQSQSPDALTIFLCVFAAILAAWAVKAVYEEWQLRRAAALMVEQMQQISEQSQAQLARIQADANARRYQAELNAQAERQRIADQIEENKTRLGMQKAESDRKEAAWQLFYKPSSGCLSGIESTLDCGNAHIRARQEFEKKYK